jgi:hypothetical protein
LDVEASLDREELTWNWRIQRGRFALALEHVSDLFATVARATLEEQADDKPADFRMCIL